MARDRRPSPEVDGGPDVAFSAGFGFYLAVLVAGGIALGAFATGATAATVLAIVPTAVVAVVLLTVLAGDRLAGLPVALGRSRRRRLLPFLPVGGFVGVLGASALGPLEASGRLVVVTIALTGLAGASAVGVATMARHRYVDAVTAEPLASWTWQGPGFDDSPWGYVAVVASTLLVFGGLGSLLYGNVASVTVVGYGTFVLLFWLGNRRGWMDWGPWDQKTRFSGVDLEAHDAGLVVDRFETKLIPWDRIDDVCLTENELVLERRGWFDVRCDRDAIDDPEAVLEGIERAREQATEPKRGE